MTNESRPGSPVYALEAASYYERAAANGETIELSATDLSLAASWARFYADRWRRRAGVASFALVAALASGALALRAFG